MKTILIIILTVLMFLPNESVALVDDGNKLLSDCNEAIKVLNDPKTTDADVFSFVSCFSYIRGVQNTMLVYEVRGDGFLQACFPEQAVSAGQSVRIVHKFLGKHPERLHENSLVLILGALQEAFPCDKK